MNEIRTNSFKFVQENMKKWFLFESCARCFGPLRAASRSRNVRTWPYGVCENAESVGWHGFNAIQVGVDRDDERVRAGNDSGERGNCFHSVASWQYRKSKVDAGGLIVYGPRTAKESRMRNGESGRGPRNCSWHDQPADSLAQRGETRRRWRPVDSHSHFVFATTRYYWKASSARPVCDAECKKRLLCDLKSGRSNDRKLTCQELEERIDGKKSSSWKTWLFNGFALSSVFTFLAGYGWLGSSVGSWFTTPSLFF